MTSPLEGGIRLDLKVQDGRVAEAAIRSTRPVTACRVLRGQTVAEALRLLPNLFSVCGTAQAHAGLAAVEAALGLDLPAPQRTARDLLLAAETALEHAWRLLLDWPPHCGGQPDVAALATLRKSLARLPALLFPDGYWNRPGGGHLHPDREAVLAAVMDFTAHLPEEPPLPRWVEERGLADYGANPCPPLPEIDPASRLAADADGSFVTRPDWDGTVYQTGPLARMWEQRKGTGLLGLLTARRDELCAVARRMADLAERLEPDEGLPLPEGSGVGLGVVEAARGRLFHRVEVRDGRIDRYQILAPTEWNFHPRGPLALGLVGQVPDHAKLLVTALDPCVACEVAAHA